MQFTNYSQINDLHKLETLVEYDVRDFTPIETVIFNSNRKSRHTDFKLEELTNEDINSFCKYYEMIKDDQNYLECVQILKSRGDLKCYLRLGLFYGRTNKINEMINEYKKGEENNCWFCSFNLIKYFFDLKDYENALIHAEKAFSLEKKNYDFIAFIYILNDKRDIGIQILVEGIKNKDKLSFDMLLQLFKDDYINFYIFLHKLGFTEDIENVLKNSKFI